MKKIYFSILFFVVLASQVHAQIKFIPRFGLSLAKMKLSDDVMFPYERVKMKAGIVLGAGIEAPVTDLISFQPEFLFIQGGRKSELDGWAIEGDYKENLNYLQLPLLIKLNYAVDALTLYVNTGPSIGFALGGRYDGLMVIANYPIEGDGKIKFKEDPGGTSNTLYYDNNLANRVDLSWQIGGGVGFELGPGSLLFDLRYGLGLSNFRKSDDNFDNLSKHRIFTLAVGYALPLGK